MPLRTGSSSEINPRVFVNVIPEWDPDTPLSPAESANVMGDIIDVLPEANMMHFDPFLRVYRRVTEVTTERAEDGYFNRGDVVLRTIPKFARRASGPLRELGLSYQERDNGNLVAAQYHLDQIPDGWYRMQMSKVLRFANEAIQFSWGMGNHIIIDLGASAEESDVPEEYYPDYTDGINNTLRDVAREFKHELLPLHPAVQEPVLKGIVDGMIAPQREFEWHMIPVIHKARLKKESGEDPEGLELKRVEDALSMLANTVNRVLLYQGDPALNGFKRAFPKEPKTMLGRLGSFAADLSLRGAQETVERSRVIPVFGSVVGNLFEISGLPGRDNLYTGKWEQ